MGKKKYCDNVGKDKEGYTHECGLPPAHAGKHKCDFENCGAEWK